MEVDSEVNQYIVFRPTDRQYDVGQHTVPFLDAQPVVKEMALKGIGIFHRGRQYSGGFIALRIITIDLSQYLVSTLSEGATDKLAEDTIFEDEEELVKSIEYY